jgi:hypothetical protein
MVLDIDAPAVSANDYRAAFLGQQNDKERKENLRLIVMLLLLQSTSSSYLFPHCWGRQVRSGSQRWNSVSL